MAQVRFVKSPYTANFTMVHNDIIRDNSITDKARGLFLRIWMLSNIDNGYITIEGLVKGTKGGKKSVNSALDELIEAGYVKKVKLQRTAEQQNLWYEYHLRDSLSLQFPDDTCEDPMCQNEQTGSDPMCQKAISPNGTHKSNIYNKSTNSVDPSGPTQAGEEERGSLKEKVYSDEKYKDALALAEKLREYIETSLERHRKPSEASFLKWVVEIERLIRIDGVSPDDVNRILEWIFTNPAGMFWRPNIQSGKKLRQHFPRLWEEMKRSEEPTRSEMVDFLLHKYGKDQPFFRYKRKNTGEVVSLCLHGEPPLLYDYERGNKIDGKEAKIVWQMLIKARTERLI